MRSETWESSTRHPPQAQPGTSHDAEKAWKSPQVSGSAIHQLTYDLATGSSHGVVDVPKVSRRHRDDLHSSISVCVLLALQQYQNPDIE